MYEFIKPTDEIIELLASDVTGAITEDELKSCFFNGSSAFILIDNKTYASVMPKGDKLIVLALNGGGTDLWLKHTVESLDDIARLFSCNVVKFMGRRGWQKILNKFNYKECGIIMEHKVPYIGEL